MGEIIIKAINRNDSDCRDNEESLTDVYVSFPHHYPIKTIILQ